MIKILFVISNLEYSGAAKQLRLLATGLPRSTFEVSTWSLGSTGPVENALQAAGIAVKELGWTRWFDAKPFWHARRLLTSHAAHIIHAWDWPSLWLIQLLGGNCRLVASPACNARRTPGVRAWLDVRILKRAARAIAQSSCEVDRYKEIGLSADKIVLIPPGVESVPSQRPAAGTLRQALKLGDQQRLILCVGPLRAEKGYYDAIWAFDILHYLYDNLHLVIIGCGPYRKRLAEFIHTNQCAPRIHFVGPQPDVMPLLRQADVVWAPGRTRGGVNVALETMAAGRPLVAAGLPAVAELIDDGATGFLVPPGDKRALARQTRRLFDDAQFSDKIAQAGRQRVLKQFSVSSLVERHAALYERLVGEA